MKAVILLFKIFVSHCCLKTFHRNRILKSRNWINLDSLKIKNRLNNSTVTRQAVRITT